MIIHEEESLYCERGETLAQAAQKAEDAPTLAVLSQAGEILEHPALVGLSLETAVGTADYIIYEVHSNPLALYDSVIFSYQTRNRREIK